MAIKARTQSHIPCRAWIGKLAVLLRDKNPDMRRLSAAALESVHRYMDPATVNSFIAAASPSDQTALRGALSQTAPAAAPAEREAAIARGGDRPAALRVHEVTLAVGRLFEYRCKNRFAVVGLSLNHIHLQPHPRLGQFLRVLCQTKKMSAFITI